MSTFMLVKSAVGETKNRILMGKIRGLKLPVGQAQRWEDNIKKIVK
jgi:hypothetical protein